MTADMYKQQIDAALDKYFAVDDDFQIEPVLFLIDGSGSFFTGSQRGFTWHRSYLSSVTMVCDCLLLP